MRLVAVRHHMQREVDMRNKEFFFTIPTTRGGRGTSLKHSCMACLDGESWSSQVDEGHLDSK